LEARFARVVDQIEAVFQAFKYKKENKVGDSVKEFQIYALKVIEKEGLEELREVIENIEF
jgi:5'-deoxynucleotidase YfbR-like HD superfamily hydrolase